MHPEEPDSPSSRMAAILSGFSYLITCSKLRAANSPHSSKVSEFQGQR